MIDARMPAKGIPNAASSRELSRMMNVEQGISNYEVYLHVFFLRHSPILHSIFCGSLSNFSANHKEPEG